MTLAAITATNPLAFDLTLQACATRGQQPLFIDATVSFRFQLRDDADAAVSLSGATILLYLTDNAGVTVTRSSATLISGSTYEIKADADQSTETGDTGKGWYQANFLPAETAFDSLVGRGRSYKTKITLGSGTVVYPHFAGRIDIGS